MDDVPKLFVSYAQNHEDVVLWRALRHVQVGKYVEIGANDPTEHSITRPFYDHGWHGITVEPVQFFAEQHRKQRPRDFLIEAAITDSDEKTIALHAFEGTGLSTTVDQVRDAHQHSGLIPTEITVPTRRLDDVLDESGWDHDEIQFMTIDVEGAEADVLRSVDLSVWRPWVLVIEAAAPEATQYVEGPIKPNLTHADWEETVLAAGYRLCMFDGVSRFYVAEERYEELGFDLSYPACALDNFEPIRFQELAMEKNDLGSEVARLRGNLQLMTADAISWRTLALNHWTLTFTHSSDDDGDNKEAIETLQGEIHAIRNTLSWRITAPLRAVRRTSVMKNPLS